MLPTRRGSPPPAPCSPAVVVPSDAFASATEAFASASRTADCRAAEQEDTAQKASRKKQGSALVFMVPSFHIVAGAAAYFAWLFAIISSNVSARVSLLDRSGEDERPRQTDDPGNDERHLRRELPEQPADCRRGRDGDAPHQVVEADRARPQVFPGEVYDHRFASEARRAL